ncbi:rod shape-determining protein [Alicyclobacillus mengziensis]|uniref:Rod shape-determining protein n=1 Tax=Alicyclobacillus mengziensis TaxID=2931921 RepID=A0A9X7Z9C7_9BACL|nr:rod shape-determining protein [Alicyclobacillus mengziensis]QSO49396.1 rod shape-determining protein [Alicyclobacillus mengziensis]
MHILCDLGTSNFRVATSGSDTIYAEPSVIAYDRNRGITIGNDAYEMIGRNPHVIEIATPIEGGVVQKVDAVAELIKYGVQHLTTRWAAHRFSITLAISSQLTQVEIRALEDAARLAGAKKVRFVNASVAGAIGAGLPVEGPNGCFVVNLGGGVTEVSLLSLKGVVSSDGFRRGGQAINDAIIDRVRRDYHFHIGMRSAEMLKRTWSLDSETENFQVSGRDLQTGLPRTVSLPRSVVDDPVTAYCDSIVDLAGQVFAKCPPELAGDIIESGIVLLGGGANVNGLVEKLQARLDAPIIIAEGAETAIIRGLMASEEVPSNRVGLDWIQKSPLSSLLGGKGLETASPDNVSKPS